MEKILQFPSITLGWGGHKESYQNLPYQVSKGEGLTEINFLWIYGVSEISDGAFWDAIMLISYFETNKS